MSEWIYDKNGNATLIFDNDCLRDNAGQVIAWINSINLFSLKGNHIGWFEKGILNDSNNDVLGFISNMTGHLPSRPGIGGRPGTPGFAIRPNQSEYGGITGRPGYGGWALRDLSKYFLEST